MKINFNIILKEFDGTPIPKEITFGKCQRCGFIEGVGQPLGIMTLKGATLQALMTILEDDRNISGEDKVKRSMLANRIYSNPENIDLTVEEISDIKKLIGKVFGPIIVGQCWELLEGKKEGKCQPIS